MQLLLFVFWGATPIPKYRLFNSAEIQRIGRTLKQKRLLSRAAQNEIILFINIKILQSEELEKDKKSISNPLKNNKSLKNDR